MKIDVTAKEIRVIEKDGRTCFEVDGEEYAPVRHGKWIRSKDADDGFCSICECDMPMYREDWEWKYCETPYCPNCGARMDGETDG